MKDVQLLVPLLQMPLILAGGRATETNVFVWRETQAKRAIFFDRKWYKSDESHMASSQHAHEYVHFAGWYQCFCWVLEILALASAPWKAVPILKVKGNQPTSFPVLLRLGTFCLLSIRPFKEMGIGGSLILKAYACNPPTPMELGFEYKPRARPAQILGREPCQTHAGKA